MIISDYIRKGFESGKFNSVIVTGLARSGKTTMMKSLLGDYPYIKFTYNSATPGLVPWEFYKDFKIFDRSPLFEYYVDSGTNLGGMLPDSNQNMGTEMKSMLENYIKSNLKYYDKPLFVFYLHDLWSDNVNHFTRQDKNTAIRRYIDCISILVQMNLPVIVCCEDKIKQYNTIEPYAFVEESNAN